MADPLDLTGKWDGAYKYPRSYGPTTPFLAEISESAGSFDGTIIEPNLSNAGSVEARVVGYRSGRSVDFTKTYVNPDQGYENPIDYVGQLSVDGLTITGVWSMLDWNGQFEMTRDAGRQIEAEETAEIEV